MLQYILSSETSIYLIVVLFSMLLVFLAMPSIIHVAEQRSIFDDIDTERKNHNHGIARLGGVAIFCSFMVTCLLISNISGLKDLNYLLTASMVLFVVGLKDDMWGVNPSTKFGMQFIIAAIMVFLADVRLTNFHNIFFIQDLPYAASVSFSILLIMFLTNAFNLIDGIDGLAGITGLVVNLTLGFLFARMNVVSMSCIAFSLAGACIGFLRYNLTPAKIFMGDTGSLLLGFISAILAIKFIEINSNGANQAFVYKSSPSIAIAILIGPIFDAIRVFSIRILKKSSPFAADRNHAHHRLLGIGFSHLQTTSVLMLFNLVMIFVALTFRNLGDFWLITVMFLICILFNMFLTYVIRSRKRKSFSFLNFLW